MVAGNVASAREGVWRRPTDLSPRIKMVCLRQDSRVASRDPCDKSSAMCVALHDKLEESTWRLCIQRGYLFGGSYLCMYI